MPLARTLLTLSILSFALSCQRSAVAQSGRRPAAIVRTAVVVDAAAPSSDAAPIVEYAITERGAWAPITRTRLRFHSAQLRMNDGMVLRWNTVRVAMADATFGVARCARERLSNALNDAAVTVAINAGFFEPDNRPSGILEAQGTIFGQHAPRGGSGILVVHERRARVLSSDTPARAFAGSTIAVQCGPRLVEEGSVPGIHSDRGDRFARTVACVRDGGATLDFIFTWNEADPLRGPGLYATSRMLARPSPAGDPRGCEVALNLDGGPSTGLHVRDNESVSHAPMGPVPWAITLR